MIHDVWARCPSAVRCLVMVLVLSSTAVRAQDVPPLAGDLPSPIMIEDVRFLVDMLERVHPDPYSGFGGRVVFGRHVSAVLRDIGGDPMTRSAFRNRIAEFLGVLGDGHTNISMTGDASAPAVPAIYLGISCDAASDGVYISRTSSEHRELFGSNVIAVNGIATDDLAKGADRIFPRENQPARRRSLASSIPSRRLLSMFLPELGDQVHLVVRKHGSKKDSVVTLRYDLTKDGRREALRSGSPDKTRSTSRALISTEFRDGGRTAYLRLRGVWSREAFESMIASGRTDIPRWLDYVYSTFGGSEKQADEAQAIASLPSIIEETDVLLKQMREKGSNELIIDLRDNGGGFSVITEPMLYLLFGETYLSTPDPVYFATRVSGEFLDINGNTLEDVSKTRGREIRLGDLIYKPEFGTEQAPISHATFLEKMREEGFSRIDLLTERGPVSSLHVIVLVNEGTFSAAFDLTYHLRRLGATLIGSPPSQSPNGFTDSTPFTLPRSGLVGSMSRTAVVYPDFPSESGAVVLDVPVTWDMLAAYDFRDDAMIDIALGQFRRK